MSADAFEAFLLRFQDMVYATAVRLLGNPAEAEDVAQTVFMKAYERFDELEASPTAAGWLKTVTTNTCLNHLSRYRARWRFFSEMSGGPAADEQPSFESTIASDAAIAETLERADEYQRLERALHNLPDHQRVPLVLFHMEGKSYQDIAVLLGVSLGKIKTDIYRGREALRAVLGDDDGAR